MSPRFLAALGAALFALSAAEASARPHDPSTRETPLQQAREEAGAGRPLQRMELLPAGLLRVSDSELLASNQESLSFTVTLDRDVDSARLELDLPARWVERSAVSGLRFARVPASGRGARRSDRTVSFAFDGARAGEEASFSLTDAGIPAGEYELPYRWTQRGRASAEGSVKVRFYAPARESQDAEPGWARIASPGIERNVTSNTNNESETFITVVPGDRRRFVVGANSGGAYSAWVTDDGGQTFTRAVMPAATDVPGEAAPEISKLCCDPMSAADAAGNVWYGGLSLPNGAGQPGRIVVNRLAPGETTFQPFTTGLAQRTTGTQDKPMMTIDSAPSSPRRGRLYVVWNEPQGGGLKIVMSQCDTRVAGVLDAARCDDADKWSTPVSITALTGSYIYADVAAGPDGTVHVVWWDYSATNAIRGDSCGPAADCASAAAWGAGAADARTIATLDPTGGPIPFACPIVAQPGGRASTAPQVDVDRSGGDHHGRVYVTWSDLRTSSGTTRCAGGSPPASTHLTFDSFVASADGALPGSAAPSPTVATRLLADGEDGGQANSDDWFPWLAVDQTTGQAWADFYSTRDDAARRTTSFYVRSVTPSGAGHALGALHKVSSAPSDYSNAPCCAFGNDYGDYAGIDATEGIALPVWSDFKPGSDGEAFTYVKAEPSLKAAAPVVDDTPGDGDGTLEPGEHFTLTQPLRNDGSAPATGTTAALSSSDAALESTTSQYPDIPVGATEANASTFAGHVQADLACGAPVRASLKADAQEGAYSIPLLIPTGSPAPAQPFERVAGEAVPDGDATGLTSELAVAGVPGRLKDVDVEIDVTHPYVADLTVRLEAPGGRSVTLVQNRGGSGDDFADTVFDDEAGTAIALGAAPFTGAFRPELPLSAFDSADPNGTWKLAVADSSAADAGTLVGWRLSVTGATCSGAPAAPVLTTVPASPAADPTPLVQGTAPDGATVSLYTASTCTGAPAATGPAAVFAAPGIEVTVPERATTTLRGTVSVGGFTSVCSDAIEYVEQTPLPAEPAPTATPPARSAAVDREVVLTLTAAATQRALKAKGLRFSVACPAEACSAAASGVITVKRKKLRTRTATARLAAGQKAQLKLGFSKALTRKLKAALRTRKARVKATITVTVTDAAGNTATRTVAVKLKR